MDGEYGKREGKGKKKQKNKPLGNIKRRVIKKITRNNNFLYKIKKHKKMM